MDQARLERLFAEAMELQPSEREDYADRACGEDSELRQELRSLLAAADEDPGFLERPAAEVGPAALDKILGAKHSDRIGGYRILRVLGRGGMGTVYLAEQEEPRRDVALKVLHPSFLTPRHRSRFAREAEILGRLQHPGIAQVIEASGGEETDVPYIVMEYVDGRPLLESVRERGLDRRAILDLWRELCDSVEYAHGQGVVHRDLKPANVLVDGRGATKVLDFGIARMIGEDGDWKRTRVTQSGELLGTLAYMSPEQALNEPIDTRADVYALGAIGYELLTGRTPLELVGRSFPDCVRALTDEEPPRAGTLEPTLRGDLETILSKALAKQPSRRYASAAELSEDIGRHIGSVPIRARPPSSVYRISRFARRNRWAIAVAVLLAATWTALAVVSARGAESVRRQTAATRALLTRIQSDLAEFDPFLGAEFDPADELELQKTEDWIDEDLDGFPLLSAELRLTLSQIHRSKGDLLRALALSGMARSSYLEELGPEAEETLSAVGQHGLHLMDLGRVDEARPLLREAFERGRRTLGPRARRTLTFGNNFAMALRRSGRMEEAEQLYRQVFEARREVLGPEDPETLTSESNLGHFLLNHRAPPDLEAAGRHLQHVFEVSERLYPEDPDTAISASLLATVRMWEGELDEAVALLEWAIGQLTDVLTDRHPDTAAARKHLVDALIQRGDLERARDEGRALLPVVRELFGPTEVRTLGLQELLGIVNLRMREADEALRIWTELSELLPEALGPEHARSLTAELARAQALVMLGKREEARAILDELEGALDAGLPEDPRARERLLRDVTVLRRGL